MKRTTIDKVLRLPELCAVTGYRPTQVQKKIEEDPDFPKPLKLSKDGRAIGFLSSEVAAYQAKRIAERDSERQKPKQPQPRQLVTAAKRPVGRPRKRATTQRLTVKERLLAAAKEDA